MSIFRVNLRRADVHLFRIYSRRKKEKVRKRLSTKIQNKQRTRREEEKEQKAGGAHDDARHDETEAPVGLDEGAGDERPCNVAHAGVRIPQAEDQATRGLAEPVADAGDHRRPASGLEEAWRKRGKKLKL